MEIWPTCTSKNAQKRVVTFVSKETLHGSFRLDDFARETIDKVDCWKEGFIPKLKRHRCICKERQTDLNNVAVFAFSRTILLVCMRTRH
jgi:hypothetical protein